MWLGCSDVCFSVLAWTSFVPCVSSHSHPKAISQKHCHSLSCLCPCFLELSGSNALLLGILAPSDSSGLAPSRPFLCSEILFPACLPHFMRTPIVILGSFLSVITTLTKCPLGDRKAYLTYPSGSHCVFEGS